MRAVKMLGGAVLIGVVGYAALYAVSYWMLSRSEAVTAADEYAKSADAFSPKVESSLVPTGFAIRQVGASGTASFSLSQGENVIHFEMVKTAGKWEVREMNRQ